MSALSRRMRRWFKSITGWCRGKNTPRRVTVLLGGVLVVGIATSAWFWSDLRASINSSGDTEPLSATVRNLALIIGGIFAVILTFWRIRVSEEQADTARLSLLNERFQRGAEMLGSDVLAVRLGGIHALDDLARERPDVHHVRVVALLCAFVRHPTGFEKNPGVRVTGEGAATMYEMRPDVRAALEAVAYRSEEGILIENNSDVPTDGLLDLQGVDLRGVQLARSNFCGANLQEANLHHANLSGANLSGANLQNTELSSVALEPYGMIGASADLSYAMLDGAVMTNTLASGANFSHAHLGTSSNTNMIRDIDMGAMKLSYADLSHAVLGTADLRDATLEGCDLTGTVFCETTISALHASPRSESQEVLALLTQAQLDTARCVPGHRRSSKAQRQT